MPAQILTFGCRLNAFESEVMRRHAAEAGLDDVVIVNTCAVTGEAVAQARQAIRRARRDHPRARLIVTGCAAQIAPEPFAAMPEVDHVIGNGEKTQPQAFARLAMTDAPRLVVGDISRITQTAPHLIDGFGSQPRAFIEVQNGCDHRCTFCIIPQGRGRSRSVPGPQVIDQVRRLVAAGVAEVVLTGVDLTSYGADLAEQAMLGRLVRDVLAAVPDLPRLRLSSLDQIEAERDQDLLDAIASEARLMPHLHLSLQAGSDLILKRMRRRHLRADAIRFAQTLRRLRPDLVLGADLIVGFPTETEAMFAETLDLVDKVGLTYLHVFPYSARGGTPAARMPQVAKVEIRERASRLRELGARRLAAFLAGEVGQTREVLVEGPGRGCTPQFAEVALSGADLLPPGASRVAVIRAATATRLEATF